MLSGLAVQYREIDTKWVSVGTKIPNGVAALWIYKRNGRISAAFLELPGERSSLGADSICSGGSRALRLVGGRGEGEYCRVERAGPWFGGGSWECGQRRHVSCSVRVSVDQPDYGCVRKADAFVGQSLWHSLKYCSSVYTGPSPVGGRWPIILRYSNGL